MFKLFKCNGIGSWAGKKFLLARTIIIIMFKDPVCGMMVDENKTQYISEVAGKKVYLCSAGCKNQFEEDQKKYGY